MLLQLPACLAPPARAKAPPHAGSSPPRGDALDLAVASDRPTGSSDSCAHSWVLACALRPPRKVLSPAPSGRACPLLSHTGFPSPAPRGAHLCAAPLHPVSPPGSPPSSRCRRTSLSLYSRFWATLSSGSSTPTSITTLFPPAPALSRTQICPSDSPASRPPRLPLLRSLAPSLLDAHPPSITARATLVCLGPCTCHAMGLE